MGEVHRHFCRPDHGEPQRPRAPGREQERGQREAGGWEEGGSGLRGVEEPERQRGAQHVQQTERCGRGQQADAAGRRSRCSRCSRWRHPGPWPGPPVPRAFRKLTRPHRLRGSEPPPPTRPGAAHLGGALGVDGRHRRPHAYGSTPASQAPSSHRAILVRSRPVRRNETRNDPARWPRSPSPGDDVDPRLGRSSPRKDRSRFVGFRCEIIVRGRLSRTLVGEFEELHLAGRAPPGRDRAQRRGRGSGRLSRPPPAHRGARPRAGRVPALRAAPADWPAPADRDQNSSS